MNKVPFIGIRYCGGCNPRYDRVAAVQKLRTLFPDVEFTTAQSGEKYEGVVVVCGCYSACAGIDDLPVSENQLLRINELNDLNSVRDKIRDMI